MGILSFLKAKIITPLRSKNVKNPLQIDEPIKEIVMDEWTEKARQILGETAKTADSRMTAGMINPFKAEGYAIITFRLLDGEDDLIGFAEIATLFPGVTVDASGEVVEAPEANAGDHLSILYPCFVRPIWEDSAQTYIYSLLPCTGDSLLVKREDVVQYNYPVKAGASITYSRYMRDYIYQKEKYLLQEAMKFAIEQLADAPPEKLSPLQAALLARYQPNPYSIN